MKIGLVAELFRNGDIKFNVEQMRKHLLEGSARGFDLICFGESFLQGFDGLSWEYVKDLKRACSRNGDVIQRLCGFAAEYKIGLSFGYIEQEQGFIYSSNMIIADDGEIIHNYRRVSPGWKEEIANPLYYKEGTGFSSFEYKDKTFTVAICGDLWYDEYISTIVKTGADFVLWPVYIDYSVKAWESQAKMEYAQQAGKIGVPVLMINSVLVGDGGAQGGCYVFENGKIIKKLTLGKPGCLAYNC